MEIIFLNTEKKNSMHSEKLEMPTSGNERRRRRIIVQYQIWSFMHDHVNIFL